MKVVSVTIKTLPETEKPERAYLILQNSTDGTTWNDMTKVEVEGDGVTPYDVSYGPGQRVVMEHCPGYEVVYNVEQSSAEYKEKPPMTPPEPPPVEPPPPPPPPPEARMKKSDADDDDEPYEPSKPRGGTTHPTSHRGSRK